LTTLHEDEWTEHSICTAFSRGGMSNFYRTFSFAGLGFLRQRHLEQLQRIEADSHRLLQEVAVRHGATRDNMKAQLGQDLFALFETSWKRDGYFVEFGATDGIQLSNTYLLEKDFGWKGILAEPATVWHQQLLRNRSASIDLDCVWKETGSELQFTVTPEAEYSTLVGFAGSDSHSRRDGSMQTVRTVSLNDLLKRYNAPSNIDYLSVDTEGSEYDILSHFDFDRYTVSVITCEHNFSVNRERVHDLLAGHGFVRSFEGLSRWDDWYVNKSIGY
jgi:FkbM family methyltransferase